ncbi:MAG TPA: AraC family transcriptional regulator ligand-binding domain-containing protein [Burkholderiaceae bacterium]
MTMSDRRVPARYLALLLDWMRAQGVDVEGLLGLAGLGAERFEKADETLSPEEVNALVVAARQFSGRTDFAFELGRLIKLNSHDILGYGMLSCSTADQVMRLVTQYYPLMTEMFTLRYLRRHGGGGEAIYSPTIAMPIELLHFYLEVIAVTHQNQFAQLLGEDCDPYDIYISMPPPPHLSHYLSLAPARFHFDEGQMCGVVVRMSAGILDKPLRMADPRVVQQVAERCDALQRPLSPTSGWGEYVTMLLRESNGAQFTLDDIARRLRLSVRTIDRNLRKEGLQFREIAQRVRIEQARELLAESGATVTSVAERLGFSNSSNFSRAFKRLTGQTPNELLKR